MCGTKVTKALTVDCANPPAGGTEVVAYIANRDDIDSITYNVTNPTLIEAFVMKTDKLFYKYTGFKNAWDPQMDLNVGKYGNNYIHQIDGVLGIDSPGDREELENLFQSNVVMVIENKKKGTLGKEAFECYGTTVGLEASSATRKQSDAETSGAFKFQLKTTPEQFEPHMPNKVWKTSLTGTRADMEALCTP